MTGRRLGMPAEISASSQGNVTVFGITGELDFSKCEELLALLAPIEEVTAPRVVFDLGETNYIDSEAVMTLLKFARKVERSGGRTAIAVNHSSVIKVLTLLHLDRLIPMFPDRESAVCFASQ